jgi:hypothetical protein
VVDAQTLVFEPLQNLTAYRVDEALLDATGVQALSAGRPEVLARLEIRLVPSAQAPNGLATAAWVRGDRELVWLKKLLYALPGPALRGYRIALTDAGALVTQAQGIEWLPVGLPLVAEYRDFYVPVGRRLAPQVSREELGKAAKLDDDHLYVVESAIRQVLSVPKAALRPLTRALLEQVEVVAPSVLRGPELARAAEVRSGPVGRFALWMDNILQPTITEPRAALAGSDD